MKQVIIKYAAKIIVTDKEARKRKKLKKLQKICF